MSIGADTVCLECFLRKNVETARKFGDAEKLTLFTKELMALLAALPADKSTPYIAPQVSDLFSNYYGVGEDRYKEEKAQSNAFAKTWFDQALAMAQQAADPVLAGLQMAILGNYLDFSALQGKVSFDKLEQMMQNALQTQLDEAVLAQLKNDLSKAKKLLYITDNAGEIGFDRVCARQLQTAYPDLEITFCVRGGAALNDATREDALEVGVEFPVIDNGTRIPGTELELICEEAKKAMEAADVILSKGMANVETLYGCGYNIYYAFLVKCVRFEALFQKPLMTPMLVAEKGCK